MGVYYISIEVSAQNYTLYYEHALYTMLVICVFETARTG